MTMKYYATFAMAICLLLAPVSINTDHDTWSIVVTINGNDYVMDYDLSLSDCLASMEQYNHPSCIRD